jgi:general secretion pathway protein G
MRIFRSRLTGGAVRAGWGVRRRGSMRQSRVWRACAPGFTLIELLVVLSVIMILTSIALFQYRNAQLGAKEAVLKSNLFHMRDAIDQYYADKGTYPDSIDSLVSENYLRRVPLDPITNSTSTWVTVPADPDPNNPSASVGIYDVKSGASDRTALDGSRYSDWQP